MEKRWINLPVVVAREIFVEKSGKKLWKYYRKKFKNTDNSNSYRPGAVSRARRI